VWHRTFIRHKTMIGGNSVFFSFQVCYTKHILFLIFLLLLRVEAWEAITALMVTKNGESFGKGEFVITGNWCWIMFNYALFCKLVAPLYFKGKSRPVGNVSSLSYGTEHEGCTVRAGDYIFYMQGKRKSSIGNRVFCTPQNSISS